MTDGGDEQGEGWSALTRGRAFIVAAAVLWSLSGVLTKSLALDPPAIAFYRSLFAGLALVPFVPRERRVVLPGMLLLGLTFGAMTGLYIAAIKATTAANAIILQYTATFWMIPASALLLHERPDRRSMIGVALACLGIGLIVAYGGGGRPGESRGIALGLASGLMYALVAVGMRKFRMIDPTWLSAFNNLGAALTLGAWIGATTGPITVPTAGQAAFLLAFGVIQMAIPYALFARGLQVVRAPEAGLLGLIEPILNPIWVAIAVGERPTPATVVGGLFLLSGVAVRYVPWGPGARSAS